MRFVKFGWKCLRKLSVVMFKISIVIGNLCLTIGKKVLRIIISIGRKVITTIISIPSILVNLRIEDLSPKNIKRNLMLLRKRVRERLRNYFWDLVEEYIFKYRYVPEDVYYYLRKEFIRRGRRAYSKFRKTRFGKFTIRVVKWTYRQYLKARRIAYKILVAKSPEPFLIEYQDWWDAFDNFGGIEYPADVVRAAQHPNVSAFRFPFKLEPRFIDDDDPDEDLELDEMDEDIIYTGPYEWGIIPTTIGYVYNSGDYGTVSDVLEDFDVIPLEYKFFHEDKLLQQVILDMIDEVPAVNFRTTPGGYVEPFLDKKLGKRLVVQRIVGDLSEIIPVKRAWNKAKPLFEPIIDEWTGVMMELTNEEDKRHLRLLSKCYKLLPFRRRIEWSLEWAYSNFLRQPYYKELFVKDTFNEHAFDLDFKLEEAFEKVTPLMEFDSLEDWAYLQLKYGPQRLVRRSLLYFFPVEKEAFYHRLWKYSHFPSDFYWETSVPRVSELLDRFDWENYNTYYNVPTYHLKRLPISPIEDKMSRGELTEVFYKGEVTEVFYGIHNHYCINTAHPYWIYKSMLWGLSPLDLEDLPEVLGATFRDPVEMTSTSQRRRWPLLDRYFELLFDLFENDKEFGIIIGSTLVMIFHMMYFPISNLVIFEGSKYFDYTLTWRARRYWSRWFLTPGIRVEDDWGEGPIDYHHGVQKSPAIWHYENRIYPWWHGRDYEFREQKWKPRFFKYDPSIFYYENRYLSLPKIVRARWTTKPNWTGISGYLASPERVLKKNSEDLALYSNRSSLSIVHPEDLHLFKKGLPFANYSEFLDEMGYYFHATDLGDQGVFDITSQILGPTVNQLSALRLWALQYKLGLFHLRPWASDEMQALLATVIPTLSFWRSHSGRRRRRRLYYRRRYQFYNYSYDRHPGLISWFRPLLLNVTTRNSSSRHLTASLALYKNLSRLRISHKSIFPSSSGLFNVIPSELIYNRIHSPFPARLAPLWLGYVTPRGLINSFFLTDVVRRAWSRELLRNSYLSIYPIFAKRSAKENNLSASASGSILEYFRRMANLHYWDRFHAPRETFKSFRDNKGPLFYYHFHRKIPSYLYPYFFIPRNFDPKVSFEEVLNRLNQEKHDSLIVKWLRKNKPSLFKHYKDLKHFYEHVFEPGELLYTPPGPHFLALTRAVRKLHSSFDNAVTRSLVKRANFFTQELIQRAFAVFPFVQYMQLLLERNRDFYNYLYRNSLIDYPDWSYRYTFIISWLLHFYVMDSILTRLRPPKWVWAASIPDNVDEYYPPTRLASLLCIPLLEFLVQYWERFGSEVWSGHIRLPFPFQIPSEFLKIAKLLVSPQYRIRAAEDSNLLKYIYEVLFSFSYLPLHHRLRYLRKNNYNLIPSLVDHVKVKRTRSFFFNHKLRTSLFNFSFAPRLRKRHFSMFYSWYPLWLSRLTHIRKVYVNDGEGSKRFFRFLGGLRGSRAHNRFFRVEKRFKFRDSSARPQIYNYYWGRGRLHRSIFKRLYYGRHRRRFFYKPDVGSRAIANLDYLFFEDRDLAHRLIPRDSRTKYRHWWNPPLPWWIPFIGKAPPRKLASEKISFDFRNKYKKYFLNDYYLKHYKGPISVIRQRKSLSFARRYPAKFLRKFKHWFGGAVRRPSFFHPKSQLGLEAAYNWEAIEPLIDSSFTSFPQSKIHNRGPLFINRRLFNSRDSGYNNYKFFFPYSFILKRETPWKETDFSYSNRFNLNLSEPYAISANYPLRFGINTATGPDVFGTRIFYNPTPRSISVYHSRTRALRPRYILSKFLKYGVDVPLQWFKEHLLGVPSASAPVMYEHRFDSRSRKVRASLRKWFRGRHLRTSTFMEPRFKNDIRHAKMFLRERPFFITEPLFDANIFYRSLLYRLIARVHRGNMTNLFAYLRSLSPYWKKLKYLSNSELLFSKGQFYSAPSFMGNDYIHPEYLFMRKSRRMKNFMKWPRFNEFGIFGSWHYNGKVFEYIPIIQAPLLYSNNKYVFRKANLRGMNVGHQRILDSYPRWKSDAILKYVLRHLMIRHLYTFRFGNALDPYTVVYRYPRKNYVRGPYHNFLRRIQYFLFRTRLKKDPSKKDLFIRRRHWLSKKQTLPRFNHILGNYSRSIHPRVRFDTAARRAYLMYKYNQRRRALGMLGRLRFLTYIATGDPEDFEKGFLASVNFKDARARAPWYYRSRFIPGAQIRKVHRFNARHREIFYVRKEIPSPDFPTVNRPRPYFRQKTTVFSSLRHIRGFRRRREWRKRRHILLRKKYQYWFKNSTHPSERISYLDAALLSRLHRFYADDFLSSSYLGIRQSAVRNHGPLRFYRRKNVYSRPKVIELDSYSNPLDSAGVPFLFKPREFGLAVFGKRDLFHSFFLKRNRNRQSTYALVPIRRPFITFREYDKFLSVLKTLTRNTILVNSAKFESYFIPNLDFVSPLNKLKAAFSYWRSKEAPIFRYISLLETNNGYKFPERRLLWELPAIQRLNPTRKQVVSNFARNLGIHLYKSIINLSEVFKAAPSIRPENTKLFRWKRRLIRPFQEKFYHLSYRRKWHLIRLMTHVRTPTLPYHYTLYNNFTAPARFRSFFKQSKYLLHRKLLRGKKATRRANGRNTRKPISTRVFLRSSSLNFKKPKRFRKSGILHRYIQRHSVFYNKWIRLYYLSRLRDLVFPRRGEIALPNLQSQAQVGFFRTLWRFYKRLSLKMHIRRLRYSPYSEAFRRGFTRYSVKAHPFKRPKRRRGQYFRKIKSRRKRGYTLRRFPRYYLALFGSNKPNGRVFRHLSGSAHDKLSKLLPYLRRKSLLLHKDRFLRYSRRRLMRNISIPSLLKERYLRDSSLFHTYRLFNNSIPLKRRLFIISDPFFIATRGKRWESHTPKSGKKSFDRLTESELSYDAHNRGRRRRFFYSFNLGSSGSFKPYVYDFGQDSGYDWDYGEYNFIKDFNYYSSFFLERYVQYIRLLNLQDYIREAFLVRPGSTEPQDPSVLKSFFKRVFYDFNRRNYQTLESHPERRFHNSLFVPIHDSSDSGYVASYFRPKVRKLKEKLHRARLVELLHLLRTTDDIRSVLGRAALRTLERRFHGKSRRDYRKQFSSRRFIYPVLYSLPKFLQVMYEHPDFPWPVIPTHPNRFYYNFKESFKRNLTPYYLLGRRHIIAPGWIGNLFGGYNDPHKKMYFHYIRRRRRGWSQLSLYKKSWKEALFKGPFPYYRPYMGKRWFKFKAHRNRALLLNRRLSFLRLREMKQIFPELYRQFPSFLFKSLANKNIILYNDKADSTRFIWPGDLGYTLLALQQNLINFLLRMSYGHSEEKPFVYGIPNDLKSYIKMADPFLTFDDYVLEYLRNLNLRDFLKLFNNHSYAEELQEYLAENYSSLKKKLNGFFFKRYASSDTYKQLYSPYTNKDLFHFLFFPDIHQYMLASFLKNLRMEARPRYPYMLSYRKKLLESNVALREGFRSRREAYPVPHNAYSPNRFAVYNKTNRASYRSIYWFFGVKWYRLTKKLSEQLKRRRRRQYFIIPRYRLFLDKVRALQYPHRQRSSIQWSTLRRDRRPKSLKGFFWSFFRKFDRVHDSNLNHFIHYYFFNPIQRMSRAAIPKHSSRRKLDSYRYKGKVIQHLLKEKESISLVKSMNAIRSLLDQNAYSFYNLRLRDVVKLPQSKLEGPLRKFFARNRRSKLNAAYARSIMGVYFGDYKGMYNNFHCGKFVRHGIYPNLREELRLFETMGSRYSSFLSSVYQFSKTFPFFERVVSNLLYDRFYLGDWGKRVSDFSFKTQHPVKDIVPNSSFLLRRFFYFKTHYYSLKRWYFLYGNKKVGSYSLLSWRIYKNALSKFFRHGNFLKFQYKAAKSAALDLFDNLPKDSTFLLSLNLKWNQFLKNRVRALFQLKDRTEFLDKKYLVVASRNLLRERRNLQYKECYRKYKPYFVKPVIFLRDNYSSYIDYIHETQIVPLFNIKREMRFIEQNKVFLFNRREAKQRWDETIALSSSKSKLRWRERWRLVYQIYFDFYYEMSTDFYYWFPFYDLYSSLSFFF